jgi:DNA-binding XRE family transcriptional regulator
MKTISQLPKKKPLIRLRGALLCSLRSLREKHGLTLREVSSHTGVSHPTLARMEIGAECYLSHAIKVANFFETTVEKIWDERGAGRDE